MNLCMKRILGPLLVTGLAGCGVPEGDTPPGNSTKTTAQVKDSGGNKFRLPFDPVEQPPENNQDPNRTARESPKVPDVFAAFESDHVVTFSRTEGSTRFPGGRGMGPNQPEIKLVDNFDIDDNGYLNTKERIAALAALKAQRGTASRKGPRISPSNVESYPDDLLYDPHVLRTLFIEFDTEDWEEEMSEFKGTDVELPATIKVDGKTYPLVGVKFRGQSSFGTIPNGWKRSLNLSLNLVNTNQRLYGYRTLNLLNCSGDPSLLSSVLYSFIARDYLPVPKANFMKVVLNGESWGIYCNVQQFNRDFLRENYGVTAGARWKVPGSPFADGGLRYLGEELAPYKKRFEIKSRDKIESWKALINLTRVLNETPIEQLSDELEPILDVDGLLRFLALDVALVNGDGYWTRASDYSIYLDPLGMFHIIPYDINEAFNVPHRPAVPLFGGPPHFPIGGSTDEDLGEGFGRGPRDDFDGGPVGVFVGDRLGPDLDPLVGIESDRIPLRSRILTVPAYRQRYFQYLRTIAEISLDINKLEPQVSRYRELITDEVETDTKKLSSFEDFLSATAPLEADRASEGYNIFDFLQQRRDFLLSHVDIQSRKSISVNPPERLVTKLGPKPSVTISEFLTSNRNGVQDSEGEREDWIELTNYGSQSVDLSGCFLSDRSGNPFKWSFPDGTVLAADEYLVIWADNDEKDPGLHTNFKLDREGGVILFTQQHTLVDKIEYGKQKVDFSYGRFPEQKGSLMRLQPTPGVPNRSSETTVKKPCADRADLIR